MVRWVLSLCALLGVWGCTRPFAPAAVLNAAVAVEPLSLDPAQAANTGTLAVFSQLQEGLLRLRPDGTPTGALAEGWSVDEKGRRYTFLLGSRNWSDGVPVTAAQFISAWTRMLAPGSQSPALPTLLKVRGAKAFHAGHGDAQSLGLRTPSPDVLEVETQNVEPQFLAQLTSPYLAPQRDDVLQAHPKDFSDPLHFRATGPYQILEWKRGESMLLVANSYYPVSPEIAKVRLVFIPEAEATRRFENGELEVIYPTRNFPKPRASKSVQELLISPEGVISFAKMRWK